MSQDALSDVLRDVRLRSAVFFHVSARGEWAAEAPGSSMVAPLLTSGVEHVMEYHVVARGSCWAAIPHGPATHLAAGDVVVFAHGDAHVVSSAPGLRGDAPDLRMYRDDATDQPPPLLGGYDGSTHPSAAPARFDADAVSCGGFLGCDLQPFNPLIAALPRLLHLPGADEDGWIAQFLRRAVGECEARRPGAEAMLARSSEMLFVDAVRRYVDALPSGSAGWLAGMRDRLVGRALTLLHEQPAQAWRVDAVLAARRPVTLRAAPAVRATGRHSADAIPRAVANAGGRAHAAGDEGAGRRHRAGGRVRLGSRVRARLQAARGSAARRLAPPAAHRRAHARPPTLTAAAPISTDGPHSAGYAGTVSAPRRSAPIVRAQTRDRLRVRRFRRGPTIPVRCL